MFVSYLMTVEANHFMEAKDRPKNEHIGKNALDSRAFTNLFKSFFASKGPLKKLIMYHYFWNAIGTYFRLRGNVVTPYLGFLLPASLEVARFHSTKLAIAQKNTSGKKLLVSDGKSLQNLIGLNLKTDSERSALRYFLFSYN